MRWRSGECVRGAGELEARDVQRATPVLGEEDCTHKAGSEVGGTIELTAACVLLQSFSAVAFGVFLVDVHSDVDGTSGYTA